MLHHQNPTTQTPPLLLHHHQQHQPLMLSPCSSGRRSSSASSSNSPEFEFWMLRNPTQPQPDLLSADQLFLDGVLLPLHLLHLNQPVDPHQDDDDPPPWTEPEVALDAPIEPSPLLIDTPAAEPPSTSKRWTGIFKKSEKKSPVPAPEEDREKQRKEKRHGTSNLAELNINLWPFSRSRSEGNCAARPRLGAGATSTRRVSSAPCSRSNSGGDSKSRKWPGSPARPGMHLGRTNPVWQVKRSPRASTDWGEARRANKSPRGSGGSRKARVLNLNVPMCIGSRHHLSCRTDDNVGLGRAPATPACTSAVNGGTSIPGTGSSGGNMFNLRSIFTKKAPLIKQ